MLHLLDNIVRVILRTDLTIPQLAVCEEYSVNYCQCGGYSYQPDCAATNLHLGEYSCPLALGYNIYTLVSTAGH